MHIFGGPGKRKKRKPADPAWKKFMSAADLEEERIHDRQALSIADIGLPVRIVNTMEAQDIYSVGDLANCTMTRLLAIPNLGEITIKRCVELLDALKIPHKLRET